VSALLWVVVVLVGGSALAYIASVVLRPMLAGPADAEVVEAPPPSRVVDGSVDVPPEVEPPTDAMLIVADFRRRTETLLTSAEALDRSTEAACLAGVGALSNDVAALEEDTYRLPRELTLLASASRYTILCASCEGSSARNCERARNDLRDLDAQ
jgi:hypothetical protein